MKKINVLVMSLLGVIIFNGCLSTFSRREPPIREFQTIAIADVSSKDPFVVTEYISDNISFKRGSVYFSTALFLSDLGILENTTKEQFEKFVNILFSNFPAEGQLKQIIIPDLALSQDINPEKNAYLFVTKDKNSVGRYRYRIESNIPLSSNRTKTYDGYVVSIKYGFYKNSIPAGWAFIMDVYFNKDILLYHGIAYPSKSAPLRFTGTGIGSDVNMGAIMDEQSSVSEVKKILKDVVNEALVNTETENEQQIASMKFLDKSTNISLSAYSYIDSDMEDAKKYFHLSREIEVDIPDNIMGSRYKELETIINYLLNVE
jgi:hypothetical protein